MPSYRVVQWATGNIGSRALRHVIQDPNLTLAGVYVTSPDKAGRDAGDLCGVGPTGVTATNDIAGVLELGADCVLYMPLLPNPDEMCQILESGANVVTTTGGLHHVGSMDPALRERIETACTKGGTSIHSTGSSPGFITEAVPLVLASIQRRLDHLIIDEFADLSRRNSPDLLFTIMGYGKEPSTFDPQRFAFGAHSFGPSLRMVADALGLPLDSVESTGEVAIASKDIHIAAGTVPAGTVAAQRMVVSGRRNGQDLITFRATWYCSTEVEQAWDVRPSGWHLVVKGDAPLDVDVRLDVPIEQMADLSPGFTANRAVNAIPYVCAAAPGIRTTADLPYIIPTLAG
jgi:4-hydroxy-tetrahydrodipicolinate reductase